MPRKRETQSGAVLFVGVQDGFGIAAGAVSMAGALEGGTQIGVVEDFAVIGDPEGAVFVGHGLVAGDIDDAEAAVAEIHGISNVEPLPSGPRWAMMSCHPTDGSRWRAASVRDHRACDAAHVSTDGRSRPARIRAQEAARAAPQS